MALDPKLLEILACPEDKGPLLYFEDESAALQPAAARAATRCATTFRSCSSTRRRRSTMPRPRGWAPRPRPRASSRHSRVGTVAADSLQFGEALRGVARTARRGTRSPRGRSRRRRCPTPTTSTASSRSGWAVRGSPATCSRPSVPRSLPVPITVLKHYRTPAFVGDADARVRALVLRQHRRDARDGPRRARGRRHAGDHVERRRAGGAGGGVGVAPRALPRRHPHAAPRAGRARRAAVRRPVPHGDAARGARRAAAGASSSWRDGATSAARRPMRRATRHASWPASSGAPSRSSTGAVVSAAWRRCAGSSR